MSPTRRDLFRGALGLAGGAALAPTVADAAAIEAEDEAEVDPDRPLLTYAPFRLDLYANAAPDDPRHGCVGAVVRVTDDIGTAWVTLHSDDGSEVLSVLDDTPFVEVMARCYALITGKSPVADSDPAASDRLVCDQRRAVPTLSAAAD